MIKIKERKSWMVLLALLLLFAACKGETPTAPPAGGTPPGGSIPPSGATISLAASNTSPVIDSTVTVTATVTQNGSPVPNGTAVEFTTTGGTFTDVTPGVTTIIRTTTNGIATVNLTAPTIGLARVTAVVNNARATIDVTFRTTPACVPPDPNCPIQTTPTISSVSPNVGKPTGGEQVRITGTNFLEPVRVLFDLGTGTLVEAVKVNVTPTTIDVITPAVNISAAQQLVADIIVITKAGAANEERASANDAFTFRNLILTPLIHSLSPTSGPINGGTRVVIFGTGFQDPVQVFFGSAEAQVTRTEFTQILVVAPDGRSTNPNGSGTTLGPVAVRVVNINSNTRADSPENFRYVAKMQITGMSPLSGPSVGGTDVRIDGVGFDNPLQVIVGTSPILEAQVLGVFGTELRVRMPSLPSACSGGAAALTVRNIDNGDSASTSDIGLSFTYLAVSPQITSTSSPGTAGSSMTATVTNPGVGPLGNATIRFDLGRGTSPQTFATIIPSPSTITAGTGSQLFNIAVPTTGFTFPSVACTTGGGQPGTQPGPVDVPLVFRNLTTGCGDTVTVTINPANPVCTQPPPVAAVTAPATGCANATATVNTDGTTSITIRNSAAAGAQTLTVTAGTPSPGPAAPGFEISPTTQVSIPPGGSSSWIVTFHAGPSAGSTAGTVSFTTNDPNNPALSVCLTGNATP